MDEKMKLKPKLLKAQIHLTNRCNLLCKFCDIPRIFSKSKDLSDKKWLQIMNELVKFKLDFLTISGGGEPTLRFNLLLKILKIANENGIKTGVITNGTRVNKKIARKIIESEPTEWRTSICSPDPKVDGFLRGKDLTIQTFEGIKYLAEWKKRLNKVLPELSIWMLQTKYNISHIEKMIRKCANIGANSLCLRMVNPPGCWLYPTRKQLEKLVNNLKKYRSLAHKKGIILRIFFHPREIFPPEKRKNNSHSLQKSLQKICLIAFHELVIFADGRVAPCCNFIKHDESSEAIENVRKKSLMEIWKGKKFTQFRKRLLKGDLPDRCKECTPDFKAVNRHYKRKGI